MGAKGEERQAGFNLKPRRVMVTVQINENVLLKEERKKFPELCALTESLLDCIIWKIYLE